MGKFITAVVVAVGLLGLQAVAQNSTQDFVTKVAISDMFEIQSSKLAAKKGNENIRAFAQQMVTDHTKTTQELKGLVGKAKAKLPTEMDADHKQKLAKLEKASSKDFDSMYASMQVQAHEEAVKLFEGYSSSGDDPQLKAWASKTLPALKKHLEHSKQLK
jgi:putative membrane protein